MPELDDVLEQIRRKQRKLATDMQTVIRFMREATDAALSGNTRVATKLTHQSNHLTQHLSKAATELDGLRQKADKLKASEEG